MAGDLRIGTSGWRYPPWRGVFYPKGLAQRRELEYLSRQLNGVEINGTFYSLQRPSSFASWVTETPADFTFSVKGPRFVTHLKKLRDVETPLANFFASGVLALGGQLGPLLWQLPPTLGFDPQRLSDFFALLPRSTDEAAALARRHDERMTDRAFTDEIVRLPIRHALEVRHDSYKTDAFPELLRQHGIGLVIADTAGRWPRFDETTSELVYVRLHGDVELYTSGYTEAALDDWAARIAAWRDAGHDVRVHFDNDVKVHAPFDAIALSRRLGIRSG